MGGNISLIEKEKNSYNEILKSYKQELLNIIEMDEKIYRLILNKILDNLSVEKFKDEEEKMKMSKIQEEDGNYFENLKKKVETIKFNKEREANVIISILENLVLYIKINKENKITKYNTERIFFDKDIEEKKEHEEKIKRYNEVLDKLKEKIVYWFNYMDPPSSGSRVTGVIGDESTKKFLPIREPSLKESKKNTQNVVGGKKSRNKRKKIKKNKRKTKKNLKRKKKK